MRLHYTIHYDRMSFGDSIELDKGFWDMSDQEKSDLVKQAFDAALNSGPAKRHGNFNYIRLSFT